MKAQRRILLRWWLEVAAILVLLTPLLVLLTAGLVWLWDQGWLLWWLVAAATLTLLAWGSLRVRHRPRTGPPSSARPTVTEADPTWAPHEQAAWETVRRLSADADPAMLDEHRAMLAGAEHTIKEVARHYHPEHEDPTLEFTLPELLLLTERVSARLRLVLLEQVPLSHRLRARSLLRAWGYRPLLAAGFEHGRRLYALVRVARAVSPLHALAAEVRDHLIGDLFENVQTNVRRRIVRVWIEEVGRAAIELYSGRLRVDALQVAREAAAEGLAGAAVAPPGSLRLLVGGRTHAGKSTLVRTMLGELGAGVDVTPLTAEFRGYELRAEGRPPAYLIDSPGVDDEPTTLEFVKRAFACDLVVWIAAVDREHDLDRAALDALRARFAANPQRRMPPLIVAASHVDRLEPVDEWAPPYDWDAPATAKERSLHAALERLAAELAVPRESIVPVRLDVTPPYNLELLWVRMEAVVDEAQRARWVRVLRGAAEKKAWRRPWRQMLGASRIVRRLMRR